MAVDISWRRLSRIRNLATNVYMKNLDYSAYKLYFDTLFYRTAYSYRCCTCAYEHEYMEYIANDGTINEPLYEQTVANIIAGECQHVQETPREFLRETCLYGDHFAAACGTEDALRRARKIYSCGGIFGATLFTIAAVKKNDRSLQILLELQKGGFVYNKDFEESISVTRSEKNAKTLNVRAITLLESCVLNRSVPLVKRLLSLNVVPAGVESALRMSFENNLQEFQDVLLAFIINLCSGTGRLIHTISCAELAIVYDKPKVLEAIIKNIPNDKCNFGFWFSETCDALQRNECKDVLNKFRSSAVLDKPASQRMDKFLQVIEDFHGVETDTILASFHADKEFHSEFIKQYSESCSFPHIFRDSRKKLRDPRVIRALYKLGLDINAVDSYRNTALTYFLKNISPSCLPDRRFREILSVLIQENPDIELNATAVSIGIDSDMELAEKTFSKFKMVGEYICDGEEHLLYNSTFALNFIGPYLIECGFPHSITIRTLTAFEKTPLYLHPGELAYLRQCVEVPRKLALRCRDVLRKHFTGRKLHAFLELPIVPKKLEDFILIKSSCT